MANKTIRESVQTFLTDGYSCKGFHLHLPLASDIKVPNLTLDSLLAYHTSLAQMLPPLRVSLLELTLICPDFKLFNPLNERLINKNTFPNMVSYHFGQMDEERWPKLITTMSVLHSPKL